MPDTGLANRMSSQDINKILEKIYLDKHLDFRQYKESFLARRLKRRLHFNQLSNIDEYLEKLKQDNKEYQLLLRDLVIQVSEFFRDPPVFEFLNTSVLPEIMRKAEKRTNRTIKIWGPGCANGEEVFSLAILFMEQLKQFPKKYELLIYGTDISEQALLTARKTFYTASQVANITPALLKKYFIAASDGYKLIPQVKDNVKLGQHDLIMDPPINHVDMVVCRNVCIYLERELQEEIYKKFIFSLEMGAYLVLGKSESLTEGAKHYFCNIEPRYKIFQKIKSLPRLRI